MKTLFILLLFVSADCAAQSKGLFPYGELGIGGCTDGGTVLIANNNFLFHRNNIISLEYYYCAHPGINTPADYTPGTAWFGTASYPYYGLGMATLMYGKMLFVPGAPEVQFALKAGIGVGTLNAPENFTKRQPSSGGGGWFNLFSTTPPNYDYEMVNSTLTSFIINPSMELSISRGFGIRLGVMGVLNSYHSTLDLQATMLFGRLRKRLPKRVRTSEMIEAHGNDIY